MSELGFFSVVVWCKLNYVVLSFDDRIRLSQLTAKISRERKIKIEYIVDQRFGPVVAFAREILDEAYAILFEEKF